MASEPTTTVLNVAASQGPYYHMVQENGMPMSLGNNRFITTTGWLVETPAWEGVQEQRREGPPPARHNCVFDAPTNSECSVCHVEHDRRVPLMQQGAVWVYNWDAVDATTASNVQLDYLYEVDDLYEL